MFIFRQNQLNVVDFSGKAFFDICFYSLRIHLSKKGHFFAAKCALTSRIIRMSSRLVASPKGKIVVFLRQFLHGLSQKHSPGRFSLEAKLTNPFFLLQSATLAGSVMLKAKDLADWTIGGTSEIQY